MSHFTENLRKLREQKLVFLFQALISQQIKEAIEEELSSTRKLCDPVIRDHELCWYKSLGLKKVLMWSAPWAWEGADALGHSCITCKATCQQIVGNALSSVSGMS